MSLNQQTIASPKVVKMVAAVVLGLGIGTIIGAEPVTIPGIGAVSGLLAGGLAVLVGGALYVKGPNHVQSEDCGCGDDCGCA